MLRLTTGRWLVVAAVTFTATCLAQDVPSITVSNDLTTGNTDYTVAMKVGSIPATFYAIVAAGNLAARWDDADYLPVRIEGSQLYFDLPARLRRSGLHELTLWDLESQRQLAFHRWVPIAIKADARVVGVYPEAGKLSLYATGTSNRIETRDLYSGELLDTIPLDSSDVVIAFTPSERFAWLWNGESSNIRRLDLDTRASDFAISPPQSFSDYSEGSSTIAFDAHTLLLSVYPGARLYVDGKFVAQLPGYPIFQDERGRLIFSRTACELSRTEGAVNCTTLLPSTGPTAVAVISGRILASDGSVIDEATGAVLSRRAPVVERARYLPESGMVVAGRWRDPPTLLLDPETFEQVGTPAFDYTRVWEPQSFQGLSTAGILVGRSPQLRRRPRTTADWIVSTATFLPGPVAAGQMVSMYGTNLGPERPASAIRTGGLRFATNVSGLEVRFDGIPAPLLNVWPDRIDCVVPDLLLESDTVSVQVLYQGVHSKPLRIPRVRSVPGLFVEIRDERRYAITTDTSGRRHDSGNPVNPGQNVTLFATGLGVPWGLHADSIAVRPSALPETPSVTLGGKPAKVIYAGASPGLTAGFSKIEIEIPTDVETGNAVEIVISSHGRISTPAYLEVRR